MTFEWTAHRFSGGILAFDLVNTVVCRGQSLQRVDRLGSVEMIIGFAAAAQTFREAEIKVNRIMVPQMPAACQRLLRLREAIDGYFRPLARKNAPPRGALADLFAKATETTKRDGEQGLGALAAVSAMRLLDDKFHSQAKVCPNCDWLFLDKSKNKSRLWCDMAVCGNRAKARKYYATNRNMRVAV